MITMLQRAALAGAILALFSLPVQAEKLLKINESLGPGSPEELALQHFKKLVEEGSKGEVKIAIHLQDALGKPTQALESLTIGALDLYSGALEYYAPIVGEEINAISLPYLVDEPRSSARVSQEPRVQEGRGEAAGARHPRALDRMERRPRALSRACLRQGRAERRRSQGPEGADVPERGLCPLVEAA